MFSLFNKKEKPKLEVFNHEVMGELTYDTSWSGKVESTLLGENRVLDLWIYSDEDDKFNLKAQEKTFTYYVENKQKLEKEIEQELRDAYELDNEYDLKQRFMPYAFIIDEGGYGGIAFHDEKAQKNTNEYCIFVTVTPKVECVGSMD